MWWIVGGGIGAWCAAAVVIGVVVGRAARLGEVRAGCCPHPEAG